MDIAHRQSVAILCLLHKIRCNPMHPLNDSVPGLYVPARVTCGAQVAHRYTYAPPRCRTSQYSRTFVPLSVSLWNDLADTVFGGVWLAGLKSRASDFFIGLSCCIPTISAVKQAKRNKEINVARLCKTNPKRLYSYINERRLVRDNVGSLKHPLAKLSPLTMTWPPLSTHTSVQCSPTNN